MSLKIFLKKTEFAAYGEMVSMAYSLYMCIVTCIVLLVCTCRHIKDIKASPSYDNASKQKHVLNPALYRIREHTFLVEGGYFHRGGWWECQFYHVSPPLAPTWARTLKKIMGKSSIFSKSADLRKVIILSKLGKGGSNFGCQRYFYPKLSYFL